MLSIKKISTRDKKFSENLKKNIAQRRFSTSDIKDKVKEIDHEIKMLKQHKKQYLLNNSVHIFNYFESKKRYKI